VEGKIGRALLFAQVDQFIVGEDVSTRCLGDLRRCHHGLTVSMWLRFTALHKSAPVIDTGHNGLTVVYDDDRFLVTATAGDRRWTVSHLFAQYCHRCVCLSVCLFLHLKCSRKDYHCDCRCVGVMARRGD